MKRDLMNNAIYNEYNLQELEATFTYVSQVSYLIVTIFVSNLCVSPLAGRCSDTKIFHLFCEIWWTKEVVNLLELHNLQKNSAR